MDAEAAACPMEGFAFPRSAANAEPADATEKTASPSSPHSPIDAGIGKIRNAIPCDMPRGSEDG